MPTTSPSLRDPRSCLCHFQAEDETDEHRDITVLRNMRFKISGTLFVHQHLKGCTHHLHPGCSPLGQQNRVAGTGKGMSGYQGSCPGSVYKYWSALDKSFDLFRLFFSPRNRLSYSGYMKGTQQHALD